MLTLAIKFVQFNVN